MTRKKSDAAASEAPNDAHTFEQALERLETIVRQREEGRIGLAEGLECYEEGVKLLRRCYHLIDGAQRRIELLNRVDPAGNEECEPFDEAAPSLEEKARQRSRRRTRREEPADEPASEMDGPGRLF